MVVNNEQYVTIFTVTIAPCLIHSKIAILSQAAIVPRIRAMLYIYIATFF